MPVSPAEILKSAEALAEGSSEVDWRNATSRAYYAAFHRVRPIAEGLGFSARRGSVHLDIVRSLTDLRNSQSIKSLGYMLDECRRFRARADYEIDEEFSPRYCQTVLEQARRMLARADIIEDA